MPRIISDADQWEVQPDKLSSILGYFNIISAEEWYLYHTTPLCQTSADRWLRQDRMKV